MNRTLLKPHVSSIGYAIFLVINAAQIWGGIFPFLPKDSDRRSNADVLPLPDIFFLRRFHREHARFLLLSQAGAPHALSPSALPWSSPGRHASSPPCICLCTRFSSFLRAVCSSAWVPQGCHALAALFLLHSQRGVNYRLALGTVFASVCYFALYVVPTALTAFLVPLVFLPICALCLSLSVREMTFDQPMFEDIPQEHPQVYLQLLKDSRADALCVGAIAFSSGLARGVAIINPAVSDVVNSASMTGSLIAGLILLALWLTSSVRFGLRTIFRTVYPVIITGLLLFPFMHHAGLSLFAGLTYMTFSLILLIMMMQCAQTSRDRGTNPVFAYGFSEASHTSCRAWFSPGMVRERRDDLRRRAGNAALAHSRLRTWHGASCIHGLFRRTSNARIDKPDRIHRHQCTQQGKGLDGPREKRWKNEEAEESQSQATDTSSPTVFRSSAWS